MSLFSGGRILGLEWSLHRHGERPEKDKDGNWRRRIELCHGNCQKMNGKCQKSDVKKIIIDIV